MTGLFVTATDTGVGKTVITAALALALKERGRDVAVVKPVQSGAYAADPEGDAATLKRLAQLPEPPEEIAPFSFAAPLAPLVAARLEGRELALDQVAATVLQRAHGRETVLVEGAGGLLVPVGAGWTVADLTAALRLPLLIVARAALGTVNHTLLTLAEARRRGLEVIGVVLNGHVPAPGPDLANAEMIEAFGDTPVLGQTPKLDGPITPEALRIVASHIDLDRLIARARKEESHA